MEKIIPVIIGTYYNAYSIIREFGENGIKSILITQGEKNFVEKSKYVEKRYKVRNVNFNEEGFIQDLLSIGEHLYPNRGILFPTHDEHLLSLAKNRERIQEYFEMPFSDYDTLSQIMNKESFTNKCKELGIPTIREYKINSLSEGEEAISVLGVPVLVKIVQFDANIIKAFGSKIAIYNDEEAFLHDIRKFYQNLPGAELLVQEYINDSNELMPNVNSFTDKNGNMQCVFVSEKLRQYPPQKGTSTATISVDPCDEKYKRIIEYAQQICTAFKFYGLFGIEFKYDPKEDCYKIIEMNCRSEFPNFLQYIVGQNMAYAIYKYHIGEKHDIPFFPKIKRAFCFVPILDCFYVTKLNYRSYPEFTMTRKEWKDSIFEPSTMYGITINDFLPYCFAHLEAIKQAIAFLIRQKYGISESTRIIDCLKLRKLIK